MPRVCEIDRLTAHNPWSIESPIEEVVVRQSVEMAAGVDGTIMSGRLGDSRPSMSEQKCHARNADDCVMRVHYKNFLF